MCKISVELGEHDLCFRFVRTHVAAPNPGLLAAMLKANRLNGVVRWKVNFTESGFSGEAQLAAWHGIWLDTTSVRSLQDFSDVLANQTSNQNLIGSQLSGVLDSMFSSHKSQEGICIAWTGWQDLVKSDPLVSLEIAEILDGFCLERSVVILACGSTGSFPGISELSSG